MEKLDPELAGRVWQRVRGEEPSAPASQPSAQTLAVAEMEQAATLLQLSQQLQGREKAVIRRLYEEETGHGAVLRGIHYGMTGKFLAIRTAAVAPHSPEIVLRKCYGNALRAFREYERCSADPEYGPVFASMARQEREHCAELLEVLGSLRR